MDLRHLSPDRAVPGTVAAACLLLAPAASILLNPAEAGAQYFARAWSSQCQTGQDDSWSDCDGPMFWYPNDNTGDVPRRASKWVPFDWCDDTNAPSRTDHHNDSCGTNEGSKTRFIWEDADDSGNFLESIRAARSEFERGTSFPNLFGEEGARLNAASGGQRRRAMDPWTWRVSRLPASERCWQAPMTATDTAAEEGWGGLQLNQHMSEWWQGRYYLPLLRTLYGDSGAQQVVRDFGYFDFDVASRLTYGRDISWAEAQGEHYPIAKQPIGACASAAIFNQRHAGGWLGASSAGANRACLADSVPIVWKTNSELRCEPDLERYETNPYAWDFKCHFDGEGVAADSGDSTATCAADQFDAGTGRETGVRNYAEAGRENYWWRLDDDDPDWFGPVNVAAWNAERTSAGLPSLTRAEFMQHVRDSLTAHRRLTDGRWVRPEFPLDWDDECTSDPADVLEGCGPGTTESTRPDDDEWGSRPLFRRIETAALWTTESKNPNADIPDSWLNAGSSTFSRTNTGQLPGDDPDAAYELLPGAGQSGSAVNDRQQGRASVAADFGTDAWMKARFSYLPPVVDPVTGAVTAGSDETKREYFNAQQIDFQQSAEGRNLTDADGADFGFKVADCIRMLPTGTAVERGTGNGQTFYRSQAWDDCATKAYDGAARKQVVCTYACPAGTTNCEPSEHVPTCTTKDAGTIAGGTGRMSSGLTAVTTWRRMRAVGDRNVDHSARRDEWGSADSNPNAVSLGADGTVSGLGGHRRVMRKVPAGHAQNLNRNLGISNSTHTWFEQDAAAMACVWGGMHTVELAESAEGMAELLEAEIGERISELTKVIDQREREEDQTARTWTHQFTRAGAAYNWSGCYRRGDDSFRTLSWATLQQRWTRTCDFYARYSWQGSQVATRVDYTEWVRRRLAGERGTTWTVSCQPGTEYRREAPFGLSVIGANTVNMNNSGPWGRLRVETRELRNGAANCRTTYTTRRVGNRIFSAATGTRDEAPECTNLGGGCTQPVTCAGWTPRDTSTGICRPQAGWQPSACMASWPAKCRAMGLDPGWTAPDTEEQGPRRTPGGQPAPPRPGTEGCGPWGAFNSWSSCIPHAEYGHALYNSRFRTRTCPSGAPPGAQMDVEYRACAGTAAEGECGTWGAWGACRGAAAGETGWQERTRTCGTGAGGNTREVRSCTMPADAPRPDPDAPDTQSCRHEARHDITCTGEMSPESSSDNPGRCPTVIPGSRDNCTCRSYTLEICSAPTSNTAAGAGQVPGPGNALRGFFSPAGIGRDGSYSALRAASAALGMRSMAGSTRNNRETGPWDRFPASAWRTVTGNPAMSP